jgi:hypothetical protein
MRAKGGIEGMLERVEPLLARLVILGTVVEVGVYQGLMSEHILKTRLDVTWSGVDPWLAADDQPASFVASNDPHARLTQSQQDRFHQDARNRVSRFGARASIYRLPSVDVAPLLPDASLDMVFLDGDHSYEGVVADLAAWWPKLKEGGWLGGHDWSNPNPAFRFGVDRAVTEWAEREGHDVQLDQGMTWWTQRT